MNHARRSQALITVSDDCDGALPLLDTPALRHKHRTACAADSHPASWIGTWRPCPCPSCLWTKRPALAQIGCADGACDHAQSALQAFPFRPESHPMVNKLTQPLQQPLPRPLGPIRSTARLAHQSTRGPAKFPGVPLLSVFRKPVQLPKFISNSS